MRKRLWVCVMVFGLLLIMYPSIAFTESFTFTAAQVKGWMNEAGAPLSDATYDYAIWRVRAIPEVTGGDFTVTGGSTSQTGWEAIAPSSTSWNPFGTNFAKFRDIMGNDGMGNPANPLYVIIDKPVDNFTSSLGNTITAVDDSSTFTINFTLGAGATWTGGILFFVDGSKFSTANGLPAVWVDDFFGDYSSFNTLTNQYEMGGGLAHNSVLGFAVPIPGSVWLLGSGLLGLGGWRRARKA